MSCGSHLDDQTRDEWRWRALAAEARLAAIDTTLADRATMIHIVENLLTFKVVTTNTFIQSNAIATCDPSLKLVARNIANAVLAYLQEREHVHGL